MHVCSCLVLRLSRHAATQSCSHGLHGLLAPLAALLRSQPFLALAQCHVSRDTGGSRGRVRHSGPGTETALRPVCLSCLGHYFAGESFIRIGRYLSRWRQGTCMEPTEYVVWGHPSGVPDALRSDPFLAAPSAVNRKPPCCSAPQSKFTHAWSTCCMRAADH